MTPELHPLGFFLPENTRLLMLGSFPPPRARWSMNFYYPNIQNDMWRILGFLFYHDKNYFLETPKAFSEAKAKTFCREKGIGIGDTAVEVIRLKNNASDNFLQVVTPLDHFRLYRMPSSSRAYPKPLEEKAVYYKKMFEELGMLH